MSLPLEGFHGLELSKRVILRLLEAISGYSCKKIRATVALYLSIHGQGILLSICAAVSVPLPSDSSSLGACLLDILIHSLRLLDAVPLQETFFSAHLGPHTLICFNFRRTSHKVDGNQTLNTMP